MRLHIKNMVCDRCIMAVRQLLEQLNIDYCNVQLGQVETTSALHEEQVENLRKGLQAQGFELLDDRRSRIVEQIKNFIVSQVHQHQLADMNKKLSVLLEEAVGMDYHYLSSLFSSVEGTTIEKYFIAQKIERVKELLMYNEQSLSEIAFDMGYSSVQHLSQQFRKVTGLTPSHFKTLKENRRKPLDQV